MIVPGRHSDFGPQQEGPAIYSPQGALGRQFLFRYASTCLVLPCARDLFASRAMASLELHMIASIAYEGLKQLTDPILLQSWSPQLKHLDRL